MRCVASFAGELRDWLIDDAGRVAMDASEDDVVGVVEKCEGGLSCPGGDSSKFGKGV